MLVTRHIPHSLMFALLLSGLSSHAEAASLDGVFDAGWTTAYQSVDSITHMHKRLHALGMEQVVLQYAAVEKTHLYYPSQLDFLQNTEYKNNQLFPKSIEASKTAGNKLWLGLYYNGENWFTPPTVSQLDTLAARNLKVLDELYALYGNETVIEGVYIPQEIARYYWDGLKDDATVAALATHFLIPVTQAAQAKGWKVMTAPFYNQNLETPEKLQAFFESLFAAGFKPDVIAVQDGVGASDAGKAHANTATVGNYERVVAKVCSQYGIEFWVDMELFRTDDSHALADKARLSAQLDTARAAGATKVIAYDLAVLGNAGLDSLEKWFPHDTSQTTAIVNRDNSRTLQKQGSPHNGKIRYYKLNGARVKASQFKKTTTNFKI
ncbi:MAG: DUF4434 domain-containing protein [Fibrobacter sp.]|nr:DUF4434 domain-containing protein [Fibrobacter sp.]